MGNFSNNAITDVGRMLLADVHAGAVFTPTRIVIGSGTMTSGMTTQSITEVITPVKSLTINKKRRTPDGKCVFGGVYTNEEVTEPFYFRELALYAKAIYYNADGTVRSEGEETLYSYGNAGSTADYMPAYSTETVVEKQMDLVTWVGNTAQVDLTIESGLFVNQKDFMSHAARHAVDGEDPITPESIGAAPAGLIYGYYEIASWTQFEDALKKIIAGLKSWEKNRFIFYVKALDLELFSGHWFFEVEKKYSTDAYITGTNDIYTVKMYFNGSTFDEMRWVNPPFYAGKEYRTADQKGGKTVYKMRGTDGVLKYRLEGEAEWRTHAQETGAAPSGYGLGETSGRIEGTDLNKMVNVGFYALPGPTAVNYPSQMRFAYYGTLLVERRGGDIIHQTVRRENQIAIRYSGDNGTTWGPWEYLNPELMIGEEYRTTERYQGAAVFKKVDENGNVLWRTEGDSRWRLLASASYVSPASVE